MAQHRLLICSVTPEGDDLVCTCAHCGWESGPVASGSEAGRRWDEHMAAAHAPASGERAGRAEAAGRRPGFS